MIILLKACSKDTDCFCDGNLETDVRPNIKKKVIVIEIKVQKRDHPLPGSKLLLHGLQKPLPFLQ